MAGERLESRPVDAAWLCRRRSRLGGVRYETRQGIAGAKRSPPLRGLSCALPDRAGHRRGGAPRPRSRFRMDRSIPATRTPSCAACRSCSGVRSACAPWARPEANRRSAGRPRGESEETLRALNGVLPDEPLPDMSDFSPERLRLLRQGNHFDAFPIHLLTRTTLHTSEPARPRDLLGRAPVPTQRADGSPDAAEELPGTGVDLAPGSRSGAPWSKWPSAARAASWSPSPWTRSPADPRVMRILVRGDEAHRGQCTRGVVEEGTVRVGDEIRIA